MSRDAKKGGEELVAAGYSKRNLIDKLGIKASSLSIGSWIVETALPALGGSIPLSQGDRPLQT